MEALNIRAEYFKAFPNKHAQTEARILAWADNKVQFDGWVKDDGDYYTGEEWDAEEERLAETEEQRILEDQAEHERQEWAREQQDQYDDYWYNGL